METPEILNHPEILLAMSVIPESHYSP